MKKIFISLLCVFLICTFSVVAFAVEEVPTDTEIASEGENSGEETIEKTMTEIIADYVRENVEEISVIGTLLLTMFYEVRKHGKLNGSIGTLNNNAIAVANNSATAIASALSKAEEIAGVVEGYKEKIESLLDEIRKSDEEKNALKDALVRVEGYLNTAKLANIEFADELANLLCLANIPNSKKEEFFARHRAAIDAIAVADNTEVKKDGQEP